MKLIWQLLKKKAIAREENNWETGYCEPTLEKFKAAFFSNSGLNSLAQQCAGNKPGSMPLNDRGNPLLTTAEALFYLFSNQYDRLSDEHRKAPSLFWAIAQEIKVDVFNKPKKIHVSALSPDFFADFDGDLISLIAECKRKDFAVNLVEQALSTGQLKLTSPFSANKACCRESYEVAPDLNCLRFVDGEHSFFLIQLLSSADGIYFPADNLLVSIAHVNESHAGRLQEKLVKDFAKIITYATSANTFSGIIASHSRPSHFYYDVWPVLFELADKQALFANLAAVIMRRNHDFNDPGLLFDCRNHQVLDSEAIDRIAVNENKWFIHAGRQQHLSDPLCYEVADRYLVDKVQQFPTAAASAKMAEIAACYPVIWIGVEGQKRCWLEQVEGYAYILNHLARLYPKLGVVFDGWTMPFTPSAASIGEAEKDHQVARDIQQLLDVNINYVSVIGETSNTKLMVGKAADFFISNFSTGSLHISRLLAKPGFCHLSRSFSKIALRHAMHIHPNPRVYLLPKEYVSDQADQDIRHDFLSYSIDKAVFYRFIKERLAMVLDNNSHSSIKFFIEPSYSVCFDLRVYLKMATHGNFLHIGAGEAKILALKQYPESHLQRQLIYGTFPFGSDRKANLHADYLIWLRQPLSRVCYHAMSLMLIAADKGQFLTVGDVLKAGHKVLDNYFTRLLSGDFATPFGQCSEQMLTTAIRNLQNRFIYIGINEKPAESYDALCAMMNWDRSLFADVAPVSYQFNESEFSAEDLHLAEQMNGFDLRLYEAALAIFNSGLARKETNAVCLY